MKSKSKDYIKGFKHGVKWLQIYSRTIDAELKIFDEEKFYKDVKEAIKSLKEGR